MTIAQGMLVLACLMTGTAMAQDAKVTQLLSKDLTDLPGKEGLKGGKEITLTPGQSFYEGPDDVHVVGRNASNSKPARFVVFFVKEKGAPVLVPVK
jgi:hypothetical protein